MAGRAEQRKVARLVKPLKLLAGAALVCAQPIAAYSSVYIQIYREFVGILTQGSNLADGVLRFGRL